MGEQIDVEQRNTTARTLSCYADRVVFKLLLLLAAFSVAPSAQSTHGGLVGTVHDALGLPVPEAEFDVENVGTGARWTVTTKADGSSHFLGLPAGTYRIEVSKPGFATLHRDGLVVRVGDRAVIDLTLTVGDLSQSMLVTAVAPLLQANRGTVSFTVDRVTSLPLDGRNFVPLIALSPVVSLPAGSVLPRINGSRPRVSEYIYDGISVLQPEPGQVAFYPVIDAIEEFRVEVNSYAAEYGRSNGGVILINQKAGTNDFHGTVFEFFRNEKLNARNLFATTGAKPLFRRNQYGFTLGGPIRRNRTFFFTDWQGTRLTTGVVRTSTVPTGSERRGVFGTPVFDPASTLRSDGGFIRIQFPNNTVPTSRFDRAAIAVADRYPLPNVSAGGGEMGANNFRRIGNDETVQDQWDARVDQYAGDRHRLFMRYSFVRDHSRRTSPLPDGSGKITAGVTGDTLTRADAVAAEHTFHIAPEAVSQVRFGFTRRRFDRSSLRTGQSAAAVSLIPNIPVSSFSDALPTYDIAGLQQIGPPASGNALFTTSVTQIIHHLAWTHGANSMKMGGDLRWQKLAALQPASPTGNFQFTGIFTAGLNHAGTPVANTGSSFASFLTGQVGRFSIDAQPEMVKPRAAIAEFFTQDDWRATRRLTLNLGVRYTLNFPSTVEGDRGAVFDLRAQQLDFLGRDGFPRSARILERANFAPRAGLAYKVTESFVIRSGYGMTWIEQAGISTPFTTPFFPFLQTLGQQSLDNIDAAFTLSQGPTVRLQPPGRDSGIGQGVFGVQRDNGSGYAQQWNFSLQKTIHENWSVEAGYLGSKLTRLGVPDGNLNQLTTEQLALGPFLTQQVANPYFGIIPANTSLGAPSIARNQLLRPYPRFTTVALYRNNTGHSTYHSLQSRAEKRFSRGLTFTAAYTWSRLIDDAGAVFDSAVLTGPVINFQAADSLNKRLEKDVSTGNTPHTFSSGFVYDLPWAGWQVGGILRLQSGTPVAVTQATNLNAFAGFGIQRPNRVSNPTLPGALRTTGEWFDTSAFRPAGQFAIGNSSRNPVEGPGYRTLDLMLGKTFAVGERWRAEFRAEAFNVTNTPPLGNPNGSFGAAAFGTITTALEPRVFELVVKVHFR